MRIIVQVRQLVSSNVTTMVQAASNPVRMLKLLRAEIEESDISLHGEISKLERQKERAEAKAVQLASDSKNWLDKAKVAMDHGREDLARSALLAREDAKLGSDQQKADAVRLSDEIAEAKTAVEQLQAKLAETNAKLRELAAAEEAGCETASGSARGSATDRRLDRIAKLERRVGHALNDQPESTPSHAAIDAEIASLARAAAVDADLEKLRQAASTKSKLAAKRKAG